MFVSISNTPRPYAWGSETAIAELLGHEFSGKPEAELWLGAHAGSPSRIDDPGSAGGATDLATWIAAEPRLTLGPYAGAGRLPFLLKLLAAGAPLSLQAHPTEEQAREGFDRENLAGVPLDGPHRNYKDAYPKPELIFALSDTFDALCGFRKISEVRDLLTELLQRGDSAEVRTLLERANADAALPDLVGWLSSGGKDVDALVAAVSELAGLASDAGEAAGYSAELETARALAVAYPGDPGIVLSLLLNRVTLRRGEVLYLPAGNIHAYLFGLGVELMTASDNVLRGGLTPKHVDAAELLRVLDFTPLPVPYLEAEHPLDGVEVFRPDVPDFVLVRFTGRASGAATYPLAGPGIAICVSGAATITGVTSVEVRRGEAVYITPDEGEITVAGGGEVFLATTGTRVD